jgi:hypothetical protein
MTPFSTGLGAGGVGGGSELSRKVFKIPPKSGLYLEATASKASPTAA